VEVVTAAVVGDVAERAGGAAEVARRAVLCQGFLCGLQAVDVALVVRIVVPGQHLLRDVGFECVVVVR
jgi:hypothetical protein